MRRISTDDLPLPPSQDMFLNRPVGLLCLLDEQSAFPKATDDHFVTKINQAFGKLPFFIQAKGSVSGTFAVQHYAGKVRTCNWEF